MKQLHDIFNDVLTNGALKDDRTGVGTQSVFGTMQKFDLKAGFPAVTTKKLAFKSVLSELLWFIQGSVDTKELSNILRNKSDGFTIWDDNASSFTGSRYDGDCGRLYGHQWRFKKKYLPHFHPNIDAVISAELPFKDHTPSNEYNQGKYSDFDQTDAAEVMLFGIWKDLMDSELPVAKRWYNFDLFSEDVKKLPDWIYKKHFPEEYGLSSLYNSTNVFSRYTTRWLDRKNHDMLDEQPIVAYKGSKVIHAQGFKDMANYINLSAEDMQKAYNKSIELDGWTFKVTTSGNKYIYLDQVDRLIKDLKIDPNGRRHIINAWDATEFDQSALPPCHAMSQYYVKEVDGKKLLSCAYYQR